MSLPLCINISVPFSMTSRGILNFSEFEVGGEGLAIYCHTLKLSSLFYT
jgi:hypothetical protein